MFRRSFARIALPLAVSAMLIAVATVVASPQPETQPSVPTTGKAHKPPKDHPLPPPRIADSFIAPKATIDKMIADYDLRPHPLPTIPDNPPPHEGAMIDLPYFMAPPDLVLIEVLEALPGRPISGERLIRPDGKISLGFYGEVPVRGLTIPQLKVAVIKHLRAFLSDETLGLMQPVLDDEDQALPIPKPAAPGTSAGSGKPHPRTRQG